MLARDGRRRWARPPAPFVYAYTSMCKTAEGSSMSTTRTNIELDDELISTAMRLYGTRTKKQTVDLALRRLIGSRLTTEEALALEGAGWDGDLAQMRDDAPPATA